MNLLLPLIFMHAPVYIYIHHYIHFSTIIHHYVYSTKTSNTKPTASYNTFNMIKRFQKVKSQNYSLLTKKLTG